MSAPCSSRTAPWRSRPPMTSPADLCDPPPSPRRRRPVGPGTSASRTAEAPVMSIPAATQTTRPPNECLREYLGGARRSRGPQAQLPVGLARAPVDRELRCHRPFRGLPRASGIDRHLDDRRGLRHAQRDLPGDRRGHGSGRGPFQYRSCAALRADRGLPQAALLPDPAARQRLLDRQRRSGDVDRLSARSAVHVAAWPPNRHDLPTAYESFPLQSYRYVLYGMGFATDFPAAQATFSRMQNSPSVSLSASPQITRATVEGLPDHRALIDEVYANGYRQPATAA